MTILFHGARKLDITGQVDDFWMLVRGDGILATGSGKEMPTASETVDVDGRWMVPGFIDLHGHGGGGHAYDDGPAAIGGALAAHRAHGTTRTVLSLVANPMAQLRESLGVIADLAESDPLVLGSHLEGPFLSPEHRGAHNPDFLIDPSPYRVDELLEASRGTLRQVTIAPELPNALDAIDVLVEAGVVVAVGHTDATFESTREAFDRGARLLTHAFNAMPGIHHRAPGPVVAAFGDDRVTLELILDGRHVHPQVAALAFREAPHRIALVTDAMAAAGASDGDYRLGSLNVTVRHGLAVLSGTSTIAGSTLTQDVALRCAIDNAGVSPADAVAAVTATPARVLGLGHRLGRLAPGFAADAVLLDHDWQVGEVWANGLRIA
ncbi:N-acetylglucosamine-6-phosphate deacetylase [Lacisediminihabitans profunda]|uniref:N-acetylglucosamine-6-phosphate deacetylase n=1 Tax=Lacisediminihabitans profunda TaxID=2594790 RepID=A0A5C8UY54_9MICO|nr:N-acetylglucosamine-6-phosphate deacetylase [Lacisediminihabitans profunda]TXN32626.1 N-acetylglucosamine-6-phosphate deacetylase [Lacisediminihabitans profunda]